MSARRVVRTVEVKPAPEVGVKSDNGKLEFHLLPNEAVRSVVRVLMYGAYKALRPDGQYGYGPDNWKHVKNARRRYYDAALRHLTAWYDGDRYDFDSGEPHLAHAACCVLFLLGLELEKGLDFNDE